MGSSGENGDPSVRAREWVRAEQAAICDLITPWSHGTVARSTRFPDYYAYNLVRVEREPELDAEELIAICGQALAPLAHRRLDFEVISAAERLRADFARRGWSTERLLWMRHQRPLPDRARAAVVEIAYEDAAHLRDTWHRQHTPTGADDSDFHAQAREVALRQGTRTLAAHAGRRPVGFAQLTEHGGSAEITQVYVLPGHRGAGLGTALMSAAVELAGDPRDLWICADDEDRPKELYGRLGFTGVRTSMTFQLRPGGG